MPEFPDIDIVLCRDKLTPNSPLAVTPDDRIVAIYGAGRPGLVAPGRGLPSHLPSLRKLEEFVPAPAAGTAERCDLHGLSLSKSGRLNLNQRPDPPLLLRVLGEAIVMLEGWRLEETGASTMVSTEQEMKNDLCAISGDRLLREHKSNRYSGQLAGWM